MAVTGRVRFLTTLQRAGDGVSPAGKRYLKNIPELSTESCPALFNTLAADE